MNLHTEVIYRLIVFADTELEVIFFGPCDKGILSLVNIVSRWRFFSLVISLDSYNIVITLVLPKNNTKFHSIITFMDRHFLSICSAERRSWAEMRLNRTLRSATGIG